MSVPTATEPKVHTEALQPFAMQMRGPVLAPEDLGYEEARRRASATENEDLFWAVRGAGSNFGVVTSNPTNLCRMNLNVPRSRS